MEVMMPSTYKGEKTNASVIHCLGVDTEETVIESAQYAAPELVIPIEPPKRGMLLPRGKRLQHPRTIRFATGVSIMISRQSAATIEAKNTTCDGDDNFSGLHNHFRPMLSPPYLRDILLTVSMMCWFTPSRDKLLK